MAKIDFKLKDENQQVVNVYFEKGSKYPSFVLMNGQVRKPRICRFGFGYSVEWMTDEEFEEVMTVQNYRHENRTWLQRLFNVQV